jgi:hypothetical protein
MMHSHPWSVESYRRRLSAPPPAILLFCACALIIFPIICVILAMPLSAQTRALVMPRHLGELVAESQTVVQGTVTSVTLEPHPQLKNLMTVVVAVQVEDTLKGQPGATYTFRQAVLDPKDLRQKMGYATGQHVLLLMMQPSQYGLTSPAGLQQGRFQIRASKDGTLQATNGEGNMSLFRGLSQQVQAKGLHLTPQAQAMVARTESGPVPLDQLKSLIRTLAAEK